MALGRPKPEPDRNLQRPWLWTDFGRRTVRIWPRSGRQKSPPEGRVCLGPASGPDLHGTAPKVGPKTKPVLLKALGLMKSPSAVGGVRVRNRCCHPSASRVLLVPHFFDTLVYALIYVSRNRLFSGPQNHWRSKLSFCQSTGHRRTQQGLLKILP